MLLHPRAEAQCTDQWLFGPDQGNLGIPGDVYAALEWTINTPSGPQQVLIAGGRFSSAGQTLANSLAYWDGEWHPFGAGIQNDAGFSIRALCAYKGDLIAAGLFNHIDGVAANSIARWNGSSWEPLGLGISGTVSALYAIGDTLYAGGRFLSAGGSAASNVAAWNGSAWSALGTGLSANLEGVVTFAQFQGQLRAGGFFTIPGSTGSGFATWNGSTWQGDSLLHSTRALCVYNGFLYSGELGLVRRFNGTSWTNVTNNGAPGAGTPSVASLIEHNGLLYAAGPFTSSGVAPANSVATWDGVKWSAVGTGIRNPNDGTTFAIWTIAKFGPNVIVAGTFNSDAPLSLSIAQWNGAKWSALGAGICFPPPPFSELNGQAPLVTSFAKYNDDLVMGGALAGSPTIPTSTIAIRHAGEWKSLGNGLSLSTGPAVVVALASFGNQLIAGGDFNRSGQTTLNYIASWNGAQWSPLGLGLNKYVHALQPFNGDLIAAGQFTSAGTTDALRIARWDGASWHALGSGANEVIYALAIYQNQLIAGGKFTSVGGVDAAHIARWDGANWSPLGLGIDDPSGLVSTLTVHDGDLIVGGVFASAGGLAAKNVARWNGHTWSPLGPGLSTSVHGLASHHGELFAVGQFLINSVPQPFGLAKWNGASWQNQGAGFDRPGQTLFSDDTQLLIGGTFSRINDQVSIAWARYGGCSFCPADLNGDNLVNEADFAIFSTAYDILDCADQAMPANCASDLTNDGFVDDADFLAFIAAYDVMTCP